MAGREPLAGRTSGSLPIRERRRDIGDQALQLGPLKLLAKVLGEEPRQLLICPVSVHLPRSFRANARWLPVARVDDGA